MASRAANFWMMSCVVIPVGWSCRRGPAPASQLVSAERASGDTKRRKKSPAFRASLDRVIAGSLINKAAEQLGPPDFQLPALLASSPKSHLNWRTLQEARCAVRSLQSLLYSPWQLFFRGPARPPRVRQNIPSPSKT